ncbi:carbohydrate-binding module family 48 protein [Aspergillus saccharolyticus JOP 1030-1]|uniref:AMP-activated protein kinase glycogen-binding domain-containing protein n=1 Tax=Aspergillus saccharolyticus JOP 1030-1 TaxID=1450539 RepID=A0A318ZIL5_9EURO|nr:hypothetical protein BP01DRAFT_358521 [Aspergillus saccharolyticus JOP 1030-1]PYH43550.1 hypothetical protein BP01DRAFT_358521 [Aspergillus saccharolyticus JOP 1030-1]
MGTYTFRWPYNANEVYVTGTFDDWGKTVRLDRNGDVFEKEVELPASEEKIQYKFVVDGVWTTDNRVPEEDDGDNNINNVLYPDQIHPTTLQNGMAGVTPDSTTAALAAGVPKESSSKTNGYHSTISSAAPGSTTAKLGEEVPLEQRATVPGSFPITPAGETEPFSVNPIPASSGIGNPIKLAPGEKVPDPSTFNPNTIHSTARYDKGAYEQGASLSRTQDSLQDGSAFSLPPVTKHTIPESSLPMGSDGAQEFRDPGYTIQSAAPTSTTAALAAAVPLESQKQKHAASGAPSEELPEVVKESLERAHQHPEWAANEEVVEEKKEVEEELQQKISVNNSVGAPAPALSAAFAETAPRATGTKPTSSQLSKENEPTDGPVVTTGVASAKAPKESGPGPVPDNVVSVPVSTAGAVAASDQLSPKIYEASEPVVTTGVGSAKAPRESGPGPVQDTSANAPTAGVTGSSATKTADSAVDVGSTSAVGDGSASGPTAGVTGSSATKTADDFETKKPESKQLAEPRKPTSEAVAAPTAGATGASATKTSDSTPATANTKAAQKLDDPTSTSKDASTPAQKTDAPTSTNNTTSANKPTNNNAAASAASSKDESKKKKKGFFSRLKEKLKH